MGWLVNWSSVLHGLAGQLVISRSTRVGWSTGHLLSTMVWLVNWSSPVLHGLAGQLVISRSTWVGWSTGHLPFHMGWLVNWSFGHCVLLHLLYAGRPVISVTPRNSHPAPACRSSGFNWCLIVLDKGLACGLVCRHCIQSRQSSEPLKLCRVTTSVCLKESRG